MMSRLSVSFLFQVASHITNVVYYQRCNCTHFYHLLHSEVILDFTSVLGMDSSASQSIAKLKSFVLKNFNVEIILFVTGHEDGFLCTYNLSSKVVDENHRKSIHIVEHTNKQQPEHHHHDHRLSLAAGALQTYIETESKSSLIAEIPNSQESPRLYCFVL